MAVMGCLYGTHMYSFPWMGCAVKEDTVMDSG
jgi:hypothetical protein